MELLGNMLYFEHFLENIGLHNYDGLKFSCIFRSWLGMYQGEIVTLVPPSNTLASIQSGHISFA